MTDSNTTTLNLNFREMVEKDVRGFADEKTSLLIREPSTLNDWKDALVILLNEVEVAFSEANATAISFRNKCFAQGPAGKKLWFEYEERKASWEATQKRYRLSIITKLRECQSLLRNRYDPAYRKSIRQAIYNIDQGNISLARDILVEAVERQFASIDKEDSI